MAPPNWPQLILEGGFVSGDAVQSGAFTLDDPASGVLDTSELGESAAWTDLSAWVRSGTVARPANREQGPLWAYQKGTASVALNNADGRFDADNLSGPYAYGIPGGALAGTYMSQGNYGLDYAGASALWQSWSGQPVTVTRAYLGSYGSVTSSYAYSTDLQAMVAAGTRICLSVQPAYNPPSSADRSSITTLLATMKAAGADVLVAIWHEPSGQGLTAAQYLAAVEYYGPAIRAYYPFWAVLYSGDAHPADGYYPDPSLLDGIACDQYFSPGITTFPNSALQLTANFADANGLPLGIWECNVSPGGNYLTGDNYNFAAGTGNWTARVNAAVAQAAVASDPFGVSGGALKVTSTGGDTLAGSGNPASFATTMQACSPGDEIAVGFWSQAAATPRTVQAGVSFYNSSGTLVSTIFDDSAQAADNTSGWTSHSGRVTAPANAAYSSAVVQIPGCAASEVHRIARAYTADSTSTGFTRDQGGTFFSWISSLMTARASAGKANGDVILFSGGVPGGSTSSAILHSTDYRVGLWRSLSLAVSTLGSAQSRLRPMVPVRLRAVWDGTSYPLFSGFADSWQPEDGSNYAGRYAQAAVQASDGQKVLSGITLPSVTPVGAGETTGARAARILDAAMWYTGSAQRQLGTGQSTVQAYAGGDTAWNLLQETADAEIGELYLNGSGQLVFRERRDILTDARSNTPQAVFGDMPGTVQAAGTELPYASVTRDRDDATLANDIQAAIAGSSSVQEASDPGYLFPRTYPRTGLILQTDADALAWAQWVLYVAKSDEDRFDQLVIQPLRAPASLWPQVLGREAGDRIQVWRRPPGVASPVVKDCFIRGIQHDFDVSANNWTTTWTLQSADKYGSFLTLDDPQAGKLGENALAY